MSPDDIPKSAIKKPVMLRNHRLMLTALVSLIVMAANAMAAESSFKLAGGLEVEVTEAEASLLKIRRKIPALNVISTPAMIKKLGKTYGVNLFLPDLFEAGPGQYPISSSYRGKPDTLGASLVAAGRVYSHDTEGQAEISEEGEMVRVVFSFTVASPGTQAEDRQVVSVSGQAVFPRSELASLY